jgi:hypothetical protein
LHILAIAFYLVVKKHNLIKPMVTGWKHAQGRVAPVPKTRGGSPLGLVVALLVAAAVTYAASGRLLHRPPPPPAAAPATSPPPTTYSSTPGW